MFFNEAEADGASAEPAGEEADADQVDVPSHKRTKRGRKPLDGAALDSLPLYRQATLLGRFGGTQLSRNTLAASVVRVGQAATGDQPDARSPA